MEEISSIDLALTLIEANEAMLFFDDFYDRRNNYEQAYEAVRFSKDADGNISRRGEVFGKEINGTLSKDAGILDKMKYHGTSLLIRIYNAVEAIFKVIVAVVKGIINLIVAPFFALYKAITGKMPNSQAITKMKSVCQSAASKINSINTKIFDMYEGLLQEGSKISSATFAAAERLKQNTKFGGTISRNLNPDGTKGKGLHIGYNQSDFTGTGLREINEKVDSLSEDFEKAQNSIGNMVQESSKIRSEAFSQIDKIKEASKEEIGEDISKIENEFKASIIAAPALVSRLRSMCNKIEKDANSFIDYCTKIAKRLKGEAVEGVTKPSVLAAKICNRSAALCMNIVKSFNSTLKSLQMAEGAKTFADAN